MRTDASSIKNKAMEITIALYLPNCINDMKNPKNFLVNSAIFGWGYSNPYAKPNWRFDRIKMDFS